jgi:hypothetical protein
MGWFRSSADKNQPILSKIISVLAGPPCRLRLILSGTGLSMHTLEVVLSSALAKEGGKMALTIVDTGAFDDEEKLLQYVRQYLPGDLSVWEGRDFNDRLVYWLHGRCVSFTQSPCTSSYPLRRYQWTVTFLTCLIRNGFQSPNRVLNAFVFTMTGSNPSDADNLCEMEPEYVISDSPRTRFDFSVNKLSTLSPFYIMLLSYLFCFIDVAKQRQIAGCVFDYIFKGESRRLGGTTLEKLVECGFARFHKHYGSGLVDEPLAFLAAANFFRAETDWDMSEFLR